MAHHLFTGITHGENPMTFMAKRTVWKCGSQANGMTTTAVGYSRISARKPTVSASSDFKLFISQVY